MDPACYLSREQEKQRYLEHNNDVTDPRYQQFVSPITSAILQRFGSTHTGLDFGAGTGPVITKVLRDHSYHIQPYDPFFYPDAALLQQEYDYIACCEVVEHFHHPDASWEQLKRLLKPMGRLYCMTELYEDGIVFEDWYYKNDPTHTFFYRKQTMHWIQERLGFCRVWIEGRLIEFIHAE